MDETASLHPGNPRHWSAETLNALSEALSTQTGTDEVDRLDALLADQQARWRKGQCLPVEIYQKAVPDLLASPEALLHLVASELMLRRERGESVDPAEYHTRFPQHRETLDRQMQVEEAIVDTVPPDAATLGSQITVDLPTHSYRARESLSAGVPGFEILGELGRGGMGVVYKARQLGLNRIVALKMIRSDHAASDAARMRFRREAEAVAQLNHPNIVPVHAYGEHAGQVFFALGYVSGGSLSEKLTGKPWSARKAVSLTAALAGAVQHAHEKGIIHRDLKPANILIDQHGQPHITDFGLARSVRESGMTVDGAVLGTPAYMAPEQAMGDNDAIGPTTDVYGLGAILYQLLTGRPPHQGVDLRSTLAEAQGGRVAPVREVNPSIPRTLACIVDRALASDPRIRYASALVLQKDLQRYLSWWNRVRVPAAVGALILLAVGGALWLPWRPVNRPESYGSASPPAVTVPPPGHQQVKKEPPKEVRGDAKQALTGDLSVRIWNRDGTKNGIDVTVPGALPARSGELVQLVARLNQPGYIYLVWMDDRAAVGLYPWSREHSLEDPPPALKPVREIHSPGEGNLGWPLDENNGLETVLLLARSTPLPSGTNVARLVGTLPRVQVLEEKEVVSRGFDSRGPILSLDLHRGTRGVGKMKQQIDNPLLNLMEKLRKDFELIRAVRFAHVR